jgi:hypothetical protein
VLVELELNTRQKDQFMYIKTWTLQNVEETKRNYELKKILLVDQERSEALKPN